MVDAPAFLQLAGHPVRWQLLTSLAGTDRTVRELTERVGEPQNLVSYHLRKLRDAGFVSSRRSSADGRDSYYSLALSRVGEVLASAGTALHPGLRLTPAPSVAPATARVLFLCTGNSSRSQMAEALAVLRSDGQVEAHSAGSAPKALHPEAVRVMAGYGVDLSGARTKHLDEFAGECFDHVVTLCDRVKEVCPEQPGADVAHWSIPDPSVDGSREAFRRTADELDTRIGFLLRALEER